jgi:hypothetical protein
MLAPSWSAAVGDSAQTTEVTVTLLATRTVLISFLRTFVHNSYWLYLSGHPHADISDDIKHYHSKDILVLLSIDGPLVVDGGDRLADYSWIWLIGTLVRTNG